MSLILEGIDMPKTEYEEVIIRIKHTGEVCDAQNIHLYAQAIQIPTPHGRLIDGDEVMKQLQADKREAFTKHDVWLMLSKYGAPTILEAEENR